jgi:Protein of unknown function (DUF3892)
MIVITARRMTGGNSHEHLTEVRWQDVQNETSGECTVSTIVDWIDSGTDVRVREPGGAPVRTVHRKSGAPLIRATVDGRYTNMLLRLPMF